MIQKENIGGVYVIPSYESSFGKNIININKVDAKNLLIMKFHLKHLVWFGVIFVRSGYYRDGIFRFNISLPKDFPNTTDIPVSFN